MVIHITHRDKLIINYLALCNRTTIKDIISQFVSVGIQKLLEVNHEIGKEIDEIIAIGQTIKKEG